MPRLEEVTQRWREIETALYEAGGEITPEIEARLAYFNLDEADKVDGYAHVIRALRAEAEYTRGEAHELAARAASIERRADWLVQRLEQHMAARGLREIMGHARIRAKYQGNGGKPPVELTVPVDQLPAVFLKPPEDPAANKKALAEALGNPEHPLHALAQTCARFGDRGVSLRLY